MAPRTTRSSLTGDEPAIGRYKLVRKLGEGGMGTVYEAVHRDLARRVAIKVLKPAAAQHEALRARFLREGVAASRLRHPHAVDVTDVGEADGTVYLVMEYLEGEALSARLQREKRLSPQAIADLLVPVLAAVGVAHEEGIVHRDLKPDNLFLARDRHGAVVPKVVDFGISKLEDDQTSTATDVILGTPAYMAPEQIQGARWATSRTDLYALGVILYRTTAGVLPFRGHNSYATMTAILQGEHPSLASVAPDLPEAFYAVVARAMARHPEARFESARSFAQALAPFASPLVQARWAAWMDDGGEGAGAALASVPPVDLGASGAHATTLGGQAMTVAPSFVQTRVSWGVALGGAALVTLLGLGGGLALQARTRRATTLPVAALPSASPPRPVAVPPPTPAVVAPAPVETPTPAVPAVPTAPVAQPLEATPAVAVAPVPAPAAPLVRRPVRPRPAVVAAEAPVRRPAGAVENLRHGGILIR